MSLAPTDTPWVGVLAAVGVCLWMAVIGASIAHAAFRDRSRMAWAFYAPVVGIAVVLLTTNLAAYAIPGRPAAWMGLLGPSAVALVIAWRGAWGRPPRRSVFAILALVGFSAGVFALALANRLEVWFLDETWHFPLAARFASGVFPPVTPYGLDAGIGYHYGPNLLAATIISVTGAPPWTAIYVIASFLVVVLMLTTTGFVYHLGAPVALAVGIGAAAGLFSGAVNVGLPPYVTVPGELNGADGFLAGLGVHASIDAASVRANALLLPHWLDWPHQALGIALVVLVAATLEARVARPPAAVLAAGAGVLALAEAAVMILASAALGLVGVVRLISLRGRERAILAGALVVSALLILLAGGPVSDALFERGGTSGSVSLDWTARRVDLAPFDRSGPALVQIGMIPLIAIAAVSALRRKSWGLGFLAVAGAAGLIEAETLHSARPANDARIIRMVATVAMIAALSSIACFIGSVRGHRRTLATLAVLLLAIAPTALPRGISSVQLAAGALYGSSPTADEDGYRLLGRSRLRPEFAANWDFYAWLAQSLPTDSRLLTPYAALSASIAGIASPVSGEGIQTLTSVVMPVYEDALRFLQRDDLAEMGITHLHVTDRLEAAWSVDTRQLLDDPTHFTLLADTRSVSGVRHRVYEVLPGAGTVSVAPSSYRFLRQVVPPNAPITLAGTLSQHQRRMVLATFVDREELWAPAGTDVDRATLVPRFGLVTRPPERGVVAMSAWVDPIALGLSRDDVIWTGYGMWAFDLAAAWSPVWRIGQDPGRLPATLRAVCDAAANGQLDVRGLGEPGTKLTASRTEATLTGLPQVVQLSASDCDALSASADMAPFVQIRPHYSAGGVEHRPDIASLGIDGGVVDGRAIVNLWYRNPLGVPFGTGTEFRLYAADPTGLIPASESSLGTLLWWNGPLLLKAEEQMARIEFDARRLEIDGQPGAGQTPEFTHRRAYLLALNIVGIDPRTGLAEVQRAIPLVRFVLGDASVTYSVFSGILAVDHQEPGKTVYYPPGDVGWLGWRIDRTPQ